MHILSLILILSFNTILLNMLVITEYKDDIGVTIVIALKLRANE